MKNIISDKTEIFDPKMEGFGEWCQQDGGNRKPYLSLFHWNNGTDTKAPWREKFSIQLRSRLWWSPNWEPSNFSEWKELLHVLLTVPASNLLCSEKRFLCDGICGEHEDFGLSSWPLGASCMRPGSTSPYLESWVTCTPGPLLSWTGRNKGKGREFPDSQAWLCETGNRYRTEVIFLQLELEGVEEPYPSILEHSPWRRFFLASYQTVDNLQSTVAWKLAIKTRCKHPLCSASLG